MSEHVRAQNDIAAYVAGGLEPAERELLEQHLADCPECTGSVAEARAVDAKLMPLFAAAHPGPALEDRLLRRLEAQPPLPRLRNRPFNLSKRAIAILCAAACVLLALVGVGVDDMMDENGGGSFFGMGVEKTRKNHENPHAYDDALTRALTLEAKRSFPSASGQTGMFGKQVPLKTKVTDYADFRNEPVPAPAPDGGKKVVEDALNSMKDAQEKSGKDLADKTYDKSPQNEEMKKDEPRPETESRPSKFKYAFGRQGDSKEAKDSPKMFDDKKPAEMNALGCRVWFQLQIRGWPGSIRPTRARRLITTRSPKN